MNVKSLIVEREKSNIANESSEVEQQSEHGKNIEGNWHDEISMEKCMFYKYLWYILLLIILKNYLLYNLIIKLYFSF